MKDFVNIEQAIKILSSQGIVAIPTETVYGLAARVDSEKALGLIFETKKRPFFDPLILHVSHLEMIYDYILFSQNPLKDNSNKNPRPLIGNEILIRLAEKFWPGPLTLVFNKNPNRVSDLITSGLPTVAIRWPKHKLTESLIKAINVPLAAPSANPFKKTSPTLAHHVRDYFPELDIVDGGPCDCGLESTIVKMGANALEILRPGGTSKSELESFLKHENIHIDVIENFDSEGPGSMKEHYQPMAPLHLYLNQEIDLNHSDYKNKKINHINLPNDPITCARLLYKVLIDESKSADILVVKWNHSADDENWSAIFNRIKKAAKVIYG